MTTITIDDDLIHEIITVSHYQTAQEAVVKILTEYVQQQKQSRITDLLAMPEVADIDFETPRLTNEKNERYQAMMQIAEQCANLPELDSRSADEILGYDQSPMGLWGDDFSKTDLTQA
jgi:hypothetical protein